MFLLLAFPAGEVYAGSNGTTALAFLEMGGGARYIGMGGAGTAIADDSTAMYWNPGLLASAGVNSVDFMHAIYVEETFYDYASILINIGKRSAIGVSAQYFSAGGINAFDADGYSMGNINPYDAAAALGFGVNIGGFGIGVAAKYIQSEIINAANAYAFSAGLSSPLFFDRLMIGVSVVDMGKGIKYDAETEKLPTAIRLGAGFYVLHNLLLAADAGKTADRDIYYAGGGEYTLEISEDVNVMFRAGYNTIPESEDLSGLSAGIGFEYKYLILDYAFVPMGNLGDTHRISLTIFW